MITIAIKAHNKYYRRKLLLGISNVFLKKTESFVMYMYFIKSGFILHLHIREIMDTFTI